MNNYSNNTIMCLSINILKDKQKLIINDFNIFICYKLSYI